MKITVKNEKVLIEILYLINLQKFENLLYEIELPFLSVESVLLGYEITLKDKMDLRASQLDKITIFLEESNNEKYNNTNLLGN
ncbi:MAG: hypothetical protein PHI02_09255 [Sulfurovaceae bacterium]|nr:hypothetical protein [Sulfurovaceae bacterium]MDD5360438.1 hypothetical protein [Sulfurovaceae bacterium]